MGDPKSIPEQPSNICPMSGPKDMCQTRIKLFKNTNLEWWSSSVGFSSFKGLFWPTGETFSFSPSVLSCVCRRGELILLTLIGH